MSVRGFANWVADVVEYGMNKLVNSRVIPKAVGKTVHVGNKVVGAAGNAGLKGAAAGAKGALFISNHTDDIKNIGKAVYEGGKNTVKGTAEASVKAAKFTDKALQKAGLWKSVSLDESLVARKLTKPGMALVAGGAFVASLGSETKNQIINRQGRNDGRLYRPTPTMANPYELSSQVAHSQMGNAYANNAGATGDLVFALHNNRHG